MAVTHQIGIEIDRQALHLVEVRSTNGIATVLRCDTLRTTLPYGELLHRLPHEYDAAKSFIRDLATLLHRERFFSSRLRVLLPDRAAIIATLSVDARLDDAQAREQLEWECRTLAGLPQSSPIALRAHHILRSGALSWHAVAALPRATVDFLSSTFAHLTFDLRGMEPKHFVMEHAVRACFPEAAQATTAVCGLHEGLCIAGIYAGERYISARVRGVESAEDTVAQALRVLHDCLEVDPSVTLAAVYVYGQGAQDGVLDRIRAVLPIPVHRFNPLDGVHPAIASREGANDSGVDTLFTGAYCAAMRGIA